MLFQGVTSQRKLPGGGNPWNGHPFNLSNNLNGINGDASGNDNGETVYSLTVPAITLLQEAYVRKVVDTLNDLDNVLYEIIGDAPLSSKEWQYYMINYLKHYQATKPKQHPVGMGYLGTADDLLASPADWILLAGSDTDPPLAASDKVILFDMDPKLLEGRSTPHSMAWKSFMRGLNPIYLESDLTNPGTDESVRDSMGYTLKYSQLVDLSSMFPNSELCSTGYCLINPGSEYLVYLPAGGTIRMDLSDAAGSFVASWFDPVTGETISGGTVNAGQPVLLTSPIMADTVLYLEAILPLSDQNPSTSPSIIPADTVPAPAAQSTLAVASDVINLTSISADEALSNAATLTWTDNSNNEDGFRIQRKIGTNGTFTQLATVAANVNYYTNSGLIAGNTYCYRVNAFNAAGASAYTNEACKTINTTTFNFSLSNGGSKSVTRGQSVSNTITATLSGGSSQAVSFSTSGLPSGATASYSSSTSCTPTCSRTLNIATTTSTPAGTYTITVTGTGGGVKKTTSFTLTVK